VEARGGVVDRRLVVAEWPRRSAPAGVCLLYGWFEEEGCAASRTTERVSSRGPQPLEGSPRHTQELWPLNSSTFVSCK
jgi:hypothetical protein